MGSPPVPPPPSPPPATSPPVPPPPSLPTSPEIIDVVNQPRGMTAATLAIAGGSTFVLLLAVGVFVGVRMVQKKKKTNVVVLPTLHVAAPTTKHEMGLTSV